MAPRPEKELIAIVTESLNELGLAVDEIDLYLLSLSLGPSSVTSLAAQLRISRPYAYKLIGGLQSRGLAGLVGRKRYARTFEVAPPSVILEQVRKKRDRCARLNAGLAAVMPNLFALRQGTKSSAAADVFEGDAMGLKRMRDKLLEGARKDGVGEIKFLGSIVDWTRFLATIADDEQRQWIDRRVAYGIRTRAIVPVAPNGADHEKELRDVRIIESMALDGVAMQFHERELYVWQTRSPLAIRIRDRQIVGLMNAVFETLWLQNARAA